MDIPDGVAEALISAGFRELHPPQAEAIPIALTGRNLVAAIPTASGKSLIGYVPALKTLVEHRGKVLYIVPLKALASEKRDDFAHFENLGIKMHLSTGDLDSEDRELSKADIVIATSEKADSMIRHGIRWIDEVKLVIADEIHMIHDPGRGPTLEVALTKMMRRRSDLQVIALSATISNADDLADWLHATLVKSDWRPIPLKEGAYIPNKIVFEDRSEMEVPFVKDAVSSLVLQTVENGGQCLVFVNSRRSTEAEAIKLSGHLRAIAGHTPTRAEKALLDGNAETTAIGRKLASCVEGGTAFHNAGLTYRQRKYIEDSFRAGIIKCIVATPTLAAGINLPARRVVVRDTLRYENGTNIPISVMEVKQMCGRAGRPGYDPYGEAVLVAKNDKDFAHLITDYIDHDTERLMSKLFQEKVLRSHILGIIATGDAESDKEIVDFLKDTFFGATSSLFGVENVVEDVVNFLAGEKMVRRNGNTVTILPFGKRVSDLYIDPATASILRDAVLKVDDTTEPMQILIAAAMTADVVGMYPKKCDKSRLEMESFLWMNRLLIDPEIVKDYSPEHFWSDLKTAVLINDWIEEVPEEIITDSMGIGPGDIRAKVDKMDWIVYAMSEIAYIFNPDAIRKIKPLLMRIRYGVKEELIDLVTLRGIGRNRARTLYRAGYRTRRDLAAADESALVTMAKIGPALARSMKDQVVSSKMVDEPTHSMSPSEEEDAMMEEMAATYGYASEPEVPADPASSRREGEKDKREETGPRQSSLFDF